MNVLYGVRRYLKKDLADGAGRILHIKALAINLPVPFRFFE
jgi:hypothetical protein